jgi:hypothetical protein
MWWKVIKRDEEDIRIDAIRLLDSGIFPQPDIMHWKNQFDKNTPEEVIEQIINHLEGSREYQDGLIPHRKAFEQYSALLFELRPVKTPEGPPKRPDTSNVVDPNEPWPHHTEDFREEWK